MQREPERPEPELPAWAEKLNSFPQADPIILLGALPVVLYILIDRVIDTRPAIAVCVVAAVAVFFYQKRKLPRVSVVFLLGLLGVVIMIVTGILGLIQDSDKTFWSFDPIEDFVVGGLFLASALVGRPLLSPVVRELFPMLRERLPAQHRVWMIITVVWAVKILLMGVFRVWFLDALETGVDAWIFGTWDVSDYAYLRTLMGWPINLVLFIWTAYLVRKAMNETVIAEGRAERSDDSGEVVAEAEIVER